MQRAGGRYDELAALVRSGEWTTYGDLSVAAHGTRAFARHVGRAAAHEAGFPHAERVLASGGRVAPGWRSETGDGPDECRRRLEAQGIRFVGERADATRRVGWEELIARADAAGVPRTGVVGAAGARRTEPAHRRVVGPVRSGPST